MPQEPTDLLDIADQISTARDFVELIHMAHSRPEDAPTAAAVAHVSDLLQDALGKLSSLSNPTPQEAQK